MLFYYVRQILKQILLGIDFFYLSVLLIVNSGFIHNNKQQSIA